MIGISLTSVKLRQSDCIFTRPQDTIATSVQSHSVFMCRSLVQLTRLTMGRLKMQDWKMTD